MISVRVPIHDRNRLRGEVVAEALAHELGDQAYVRTDVRNGHTDPLPAADSDIVLVPVSSDGDLDLVRESRGGSVVALVTGHTVNDVLQVIEAGALSVVDTDQSFDELTDAVRQTAAGRAVVPAQVLGPLLRRLVDRRREIDAGLELFEPLSGREREVLRHLVDGLDHQQIAARLTVSPETVRTHLRNTMRKLGVHSRADAVRVAVAHGWFTPGPTAEVSR